MRRGWEAAHCSVKTKLGPPAQVQRRASVVQVSVLTIDTNRAPGMTRTFLDSGVLLTAWRGKECAEQAIALLEDPEREFCSSQMVKLELLPKPALFKQHAETQFYNIHFSRVKADEPLSADLGKEAMELASAHGIATADALNLCAAIRLGAAEFITSEKPGKPLFSVPAIKVISLHSIKHPAR